MAKDVDLFTAAMASVRPLKGRATLGAVGKPQAADPPAPHSSPPVAPALPRKAIAPVVRQDQAFDRDIDRALARGKRTPEATLDLHGMTLATAERAVDGFLERAVEEGLRLVLIVTGKGWRDENGRLVAGRIRSEFPGWLSAAANAMRVRSSRPAHPRHGGSGAFYVLLRRRSSASNRSLRARPHR